MALFYLCVLSRAHADEFAPRDDDVLELNLRCLQRKFSSGLNGKADCGQAHTARVHKIQRFTASRKIAAMRSIFS